MTLPAASSGRSSFLQRNRDRFLAELAARAGFKDQSQLTRHFRRLVGVTPGQFRMPARFA